MPKLYAILNNNTVENVIQADADFIANNFPDAVDVTDQPVSIGQIYNAKTKTFSDSTKSNQQLSQTISELCDEIDKTAEQTRTKFVTVGQLQQTVYDIKAQEAERYKQLGYPKATADFPLIEAQAKHKGTSVKQEADEIIATKRLWLSLAGQIEGIRLAAKKQIKNSSSEHQARTYYDEAVNKLSQLG